MYMRWDDTLSTGVERFDSRNKALVGYVNQLFDAISRQEAREPMKRVITGLIKHTSKHFADEESALLKFNYPDFEEHAEEHREIFEKALALADDYKSGAATAPVETFTFLVDLIRNHLAETDSKLAPFMRSKGVH